MQPAAVAAAAVPADCLAAPTAASTCSEFGGEHVAQRRADDARLVTAAPTAAGLLRGGTTRVVTSRGPATHDEARTWTLPCYSPAAGEESVCASCGASCRSASPRSTSQVEQGHNWSHDYEDEATEVKSVLSSVASEYASCPMTMVAGTEQLPSLPQRSGFQNPMEVCSSSLDVQSMAAGTPPTGGGEAAAEATFRGKAGTTMKGVEPSWFCLSGAMGLCVTWLGTFSLFQGGTRLMANGMQGLIMLLLRMQRRHLLRRWPDLMEKFTHVLSEGRLRSERHRVLTEDGHEIHFYRLRRVTRCCCRTDCACSSVGFSAGTPEAVEAAAAVAAAAAARKAGPAPSSSFHNGNSSNKRLDGKVFFFQHGLLESSLNWIAGGWLSLPFIVAARGGEVWLGNSRGNEYTRPLKQRPPMQQVQQSSVSSSSSQYTPESLSGQNEEFNERGLSLFTLHEYIAEQQHRLEALKQRTGHEADVQLLTQYLQVDPEEGECCSFFCCKCSGLTALPCITGKSPQEQLRLLQQTCMDASALLLRMHWAGQSACKGASESEQHQGTGGAGVTVTPKGAKAGGSPLCEPTADAVACLPRSMQFDMFELNRSLSASSTFNRMKSTATSPATSSTNRMPDSGIRCGGQSAAEAKFAAWPLCETDGMSAELFAYTAPSNYTDDGIREDGCSCSRWSSSRRGPSRRLRGCQGSRRNKRTDRPPFEFSNDSAKGPWSFHEMATYDCPAQLQYIAMKSPALRQQRAAALRATADFKSGSESGCGGQSSFACGLVAVGQSQGAAQLLAALSMSPSVGLLARRLVLFSPPLILQPLTELPRAALLLLQLGLQYPRVLLKALRFLVSLIPGRVLASVGNAVVGKGRPGSMNFYSTPLESQQLALNFSYTPSGGTSKQNFAHWLQQLLDPQPLRTLSNSPKLPASTAFPGHWRSFFQRVQQRRSQFEQPRHRKHSVVLRKVDVNFSEPLAALPELQIPEGRYPLERITSDVHAFLGLQDNLVAAAESAAYLRSCISKDQLHLCVKDGYGHLDFGWGRDRANDLYPQLLACIATCSEICACTCGNSR